MNILVGLCMLYNGSCKRLMKLNLNTNFNPLVDITYREGGFYGEYQRQG